MIRHLDVELASPAMIGGAETGRLDEPRTLRPPSVRGRLRFWARALSGEQARETETELFGSTEVGQRISVLPTLGTGGRWSRHPLFPTGDHRSPTDMIAPGSLFRLQFRIPDSGLLERFQAVLWTWLHLGSLSRRGRRGYGSLLWRPTEGDALDGLPPLDHKEHLASREDLEGYLRRGLGVVRERMGVPEQNGPRSMQPWFQLRSLDQVFVGGPIDARYDGQANGMEDRLHGLGGRSSRGEGAEMGRPKPRLASPMLWRVFPAAGGGYYTVMTWSPHDVAQIEEDSRLHEYLRERLEISRSLANELPLAAP